MVIAGLVLMIMKLKKIIVNKSDEAAVIVEKIIDSPADEIVLSIPRFSRLVDAPANFQLIRREAELLNKKIIIESVDDRAIELAAVVKLESVNPFFQKNRRVSDIVAQRPSSVSPQASPRLIHKDYPKRAETPAIIKEGLTLEEPAPRTRKSFRLPSSRRTIAVLAATAVLVMFLFLAVKVLPRAKIVLASQKSPWNYHDSVIIDKTATAITEADKRIPGQLFTQSRNVNLTFPASGKKQVEKKATGTVTIYNSYSSDPQPLIATTRLVTPDGKIFRLVNSVTVPGAKIVEGKIIASSLDAAVAADKAGEDYNVGPVSHFTIPGLKGTPKFEAFYAESKLAMSGGYIGEVAFPTEADIKNAKEELQKTLEVALKTFFATQIPSNLKLINGASQTIYKEPKVNSEVNGEGQFSIFGEVVGSVLVFREQDLMELLRLKVKKELGGDFEILNSELEYGEARGDFNRGRASFSVKFAGTVARTIDTASLQERLLGKTQNDLQGIVFSVPGLESVQVSLWPFWVKRVPVDPAKVKVIIK